MTYLGFEPGKKGKKERNKMKEMINDFPGI